MTTTIKITSRRSMTDTEIAQSVDNAMQNPRIVASCDADTDEGTVEA